MPGRSDYYLPAEPIRGLVKAWLDPQEKYFNPNLERSQEGANAPRPPWSRLSPREYLMIHTGLERSWLDKFLVGQIKTVHFDYADKLMGAIGLTLEWIRDPLYHSVDLKKLDQHQPVQRRRHSGGARRKVSYHQIQCLREAGLSRAKIKEQTGATDGQLDRAFKEISLGYRGNPGHAGTSRSFDYEKALRLHDNGGLTWVEVAERLGVDVRVVYQAMRRVRQGVQELAA